MADELDNDGVEAVDDDLQICDGCGGEFTEDELSDEGLCEECGNAANEDDGA